MTAPAPDPTVLRRAVTDALPASRTAAQVFDADGRLVWVSAQMLVLMGADESDEIGYGMTLAEGMALPLWDGVLPESSRTALRRDLGTRLTDGADATLWVSEVELTMAGRSRPVGMLGVTIRSAVDGALVGTALVYAPLLPARVLALVSEGDEAMFTRMADLTEPGRRPTAVLFADIDSSGPLARRLPTPVYFDLVRRFTTVFDDLVARHGGIVGKHAGDGASAFFLAACSAAPEGASESSAARAALSVGLSLAEQVCTIVEALAADGAGLDVDDCRVNVGVHWGADLYIGQIVTGGRLEVTALGDEVNECARVEHVASGGQTLVSKTLIERLDPRDAAAVGIDPLRLTYRPLAELAGDDRKALRDAGTLAVVDLTGVTPGA